jgi:hypothetical protein
MISFYYSHTVHSKGLQEHRSILVLIIEHIGSYDYILVNIW